MLANARADLERDLERNKGTQERNLKEENLDKEETLVGADEEEKKAKSPKPKSARGMKRKKQTTEEV